MSSGRASYYDSDASVSTSLVRRFRIVRLSWRVFDPVKTWYEITWQPLTVHDDGAMRNTTYLLAPVQGDFLQENIINISGLAPRAPTSCIIQFQLRTGSRCAQPLFGFLIVFLAKLSGFKFRYEQWCRKSRTDNRLST